ncbi:NUDIX domain-containing protein [Urechidicola sp. KH5]
MPQMYTIFDNEIPIYLINNLDFENQSHFYFKDEITIEKVLDLARSADANAIYVYHEDLKHLMREFKWYFKIEKAAGGLVKNEEGDLLFIFRNGKWDLPKGKIDKGEKKKEAAIREVEEECGISGLEITKKLQKTFHIFQRKGRETLKVTYWYDMQTSYKGELTPQLEEGITEVVFKDRDAFSEVESNTYGNIKLLLSQF